MLRRKIVSMIPAVCLVCSWPAGSQTIATLAGNGAAAYAGDGGQAINASLNNPKSIAIDSAGNIYIADPGNARIRKVTPAGVISTYAGNGVNAYSGDGGQAQSASISDASGIALDPAGNLYIADSSNRRIRKVSSTGIISTVAGTGTQGYTGDGGPAMSATLGRPVALTFDVAGNIYYVDSVNQCVRRITAAGTISTVAGNGVQAFAGDGGQATAASLAFPLGIALDSSGNMYIADANNNRIRKVNSSGIITTVAGGANEGFGGDGGAAVNASLNIPSDVALDSAGNLYIGDAGNNRIREVNSSGIITTIAGTANNGFSGDGGPPTQALLNYPWSVKFSPSGTLYFGDMANNRVREIIPAKGDSTPPAISANGIVNGASFTVGLNVAPGSLAAIFGANLAPGITIDTQVPLPTDLGQTSVTFNGEAAPLFFVSSGQINAQVPFDIPPGPVNVQVTKSGMTSAIETINVATYSPGIFILDQAGTGAFFHNSNFSLVTSSSPAKTGEAIVIYATGLGPVSPAGVSGASPGASPTVTNPTVTLGGVDCKIIYSGLAPELVSVYQIDIAVPAGLPAGNQTLQIHMGGLLSNTANLAVTP
jgi:uncharacterized protein (TIGR03437 family)